MLFSWKKDKREIFPEAALSGEFQNGRDGIRVMEIPFLQAGK
jgi:hypothetical protein